MSDLNDALAQRWRSALASANRKRALSATVVLEADRLTVTLSDGKTFSSTRNVSAERVLAAAVQWSRRQGAIDVTVIRDGVSSNA
ncbi:MAG TPA: hypothetical protein VKQ06_08645 [Gammaproteobacteria bacterium]|nr:hypothetical protein [Gammaproteobacteria bacterium]